MAQGIADAFKRVGETVNAGAVDSYGSTNGNASVPPTWNTSTMCLSVLHRAQSAQGWQTGQLDFPMWDGEVDPLPRRPLDLGEGWWR